MAGCGGEERQLGIKMRQSDTFRLERQITVIEDVIKTHPTPPVMQGNFCQALTSSAFPQIKIDHFTLKF